MDANKAFFTNDAWAKESGIESVGSFDRQIKGPDED